jgi:homoserine dehydrogenase
MQHPAEKDGQAELVLLTHKISREQHINVINDIKGMASVISHYRIEGENAK